VRYSIVRALERSIVMPPAKTTRATKAPASKNKSVSEFVEIQEIHLPKQQQPRRYFSEEKMTQLIASIEEHGILEPLIVRPLKAGGYELVAGERRLRAATKLELVQVPIVIREFSDEKALEVSLLENLQRDDLNPIDETEGILNLLCQVIKGNKDDVVSLLNRFANAHRRGTQLTREDDESLELIDQVFLKVGRLNREGFRTNRLPLLSLPEDVLKVLREGKLEYTKARVIAKLENPKQRAALIKETLHDNLSLTQIKQKVKDIESRLKPSTEVISGEQLRVSLIALSKQKSEAWHDEKKRSELERIFSELQEVLQA
jgi:ParB family transcriptional regulator, chromosome partitioning protein